MKYHDFEDFLQAQHQKENPTILDDDLPNAYNEWLEYLDEFDWMMYGNTFAQHKVDQIVKEMETI